MDAKKQTISNAIIDTLQVLKSMIKEGLAEPKFMSGILVILEEKHGLTNEEGMVVLEECVKNVNKHVDLAIYKGIK